MNLIELELNEEERFLRFHLSSMGLGTLTQDDHRALVEAASDKDIERALHLLEQHLERGATAIRHYLQKNREA